MSSIYRSDIDGLRAIAVLSVILFHLNKTWLTGGFIGVDVFFVISGYLITKSIYIDIYNNQFSFKSFYQRRINRILPVFFVVMFFTTISSWIIMYSDDFIFYLKSLKSTTYLWENMFFAQNTGGYFDFSVDKIPILHTWSLAVEEQFYVLLPICLIILYKLKFKKNATLITLFFICIFSFSLAQLSQYSNFLYKYNYYSLFTGRAGELLIGSLAGIISIRKNDFSNSIRLINLNLFSILGVILVLSSIILISEKDLFPSFLAIIPTFGSALIILFYNKNTLVTKILSFRPIVYIGTLSYSLYLWHWPIIVLTKYYLEIDAFTKYYHYLFVISLMFILSILSFYFVEKPCRKYVKNFKFSLFIYYLIPSFLILSLYYTQSNFKILDKIDTREESRKTNRYVTGKNDFLYLGNYYDHTIDKLILKQIPSIEDINNEFDILKSITDEANLNQAKVALLIGTDKSHIYPNYLPSNIKPAKKRYIEYYLEKLKNNKNLIIYDSYKDLLSAAGKNKEFLYSRTDTHWNLKGSYIAYSNFLKLLNIESPEVNFKLIPSIPGDLIRISGLKNIKLHNDDNFEITFKEEQSFTCIDNNSKDNPFGNIETCTNENAIIDKTVWIVGDSLTSALKDYLKATFKTVNFIGHWKEKLSTINSELRKSKHKPDYIIIIKVDRSF